ncbi:MAG: DUF1698 domain-containing protein [Acidobacteria bacterium]|nr:DUF1698 domain-containing protein [Acidobacteriota bacterium]
MVNRNDSGSWWHSIDLGNGLVSPGVHSLTELQSIYRSMNLPEDLSGKTLLDIGCWDGFYSFEAERHGANVTAVDCCQPKNFFAAHEALNSNVRFYERNVYEIGKENLGSFDIVLFLGVLHHLRHPLLALENVCELTRDFAIIESCITGSRRTEDEPEMRFYEFDELGGQYDNWWTPNFECLVQMVRSVGFARVELLSRNDTQATIKAYRRWNDKPKTTSHSLRLLDVFNAVTFDRHFPRRGGDSVISILAEGVPKSARRWDVRVEIGGFGIHPVYVGPSNELRHGPLTQINCLIPPGLESGRSSLCFWHDGKLSNEFEVELSDSTNVKLLK